MKLSGRVVIKDPTVEEKEKTSKRGASYTERVQWCLAVVGDETRKIRVRLEKGQPAFQAGTYELSADMRVNDWGDLLVPFNLTLKPVAAAAVPGRQTA